MVGDIGMNEQPEKPEMVMLSKSDFVARILDASNNGAAVAREGLKERLLELRELTEPGSQASLFITKWVREIG